MKKSDPSAGKTSRRAFTLLELLLVLMLIGICAAAIVPHLNETLGRWQLRETARNLQTTLQLASQWASARQEGVVFTLDLHKGCFGLRLLTERDSAANAPLPTGRLSFGRGVRIAQAQGFEDRRTEKILVFRPDGSSGEASIVLTAGQADANPDTVWRISVDAGGVVQCQERTADEAGK